jgi:calcineurin-like phosphoesterase family protein
LINFFTGDEHFNHENIIRFTGRPFANSEHMNAELIRRHNSRVKNGDTVYHLGDFNMTNNGPNVYELLGKLNGRHVFIRGNHDKNNGLNACLHYGIIELFNQNIILAHRPEEAEILMAVMSIKLGFCGHVHQHWRFQHTERGDLINVGVDVWDYYPIDPKQIFKVYKKWRDGKE